MLRLFEFLLRGLVLLIVMLFRGIAYVVNAAATWTVRLHTKAQTTPNPRRYFWLRFGPAVAAVALLLAWPVIVASTTAQPTATDAPISGQGVPADTTPNIPGPVFSSNSPTPTTDPVAISTPAPKTDPVTGNAAGGDVVQVSGVILPNSARTPGATNPAVTQATIGQTICVVGWTATIRPSSSITTALKIQQLASGYAYMGDTLTRDYEEDHLISLELGGAPSSVANLWPEPYNVTDGARVKDQIENKLHAMICSGGITLAAAQAAIATNWWTAYQTYIGNAPAPAPKPVPAVPAPLVPGNGATALCKDGSYSYAAHHQGACSSHGGVSVFYK